MDLSMTLQLQRVFDRVELVSGVGDREAGTLCIMSLVACLAGEKHTDHPACASPVIRTFAIPVNDHMPREARQRLKFFAPRILGSNDGLDGLRAEVLRRVLAEELLPRASARWRTTAGAPGVGLSGRLWTRLRRRELQRRIETLLDEAGVTGGSSYGIALASTAAQLIALCAREARDTPEAEGCWDAAIGLLDQLCDVGASPRCGPGLLESHLARLDTSVGDVARASIP